MTIHPAIAGVFTPNSEEKKVRHLKKWRLTFHTRLTITINFILQLGRSTGHHYRSPGPQQNRIRRVRGVGGLVLGEDWRFEPRPLDAADGEDLGVHGVPHAACHLHPDQEAHLHSGEEQPEILTHAHAFLLYEMQRQLSYVEWVNCNVSKWTETHSLKSKY